ncbi:MAG: hypothetical protein HYR60_00915 [Acidobacteria bacterium]|nr:hypothetical protein [Acidobacteriota bacterium]
MHFIPCYATRIGELAAQFRETPVILDHLARAGQGSAEDVRYASKQDYPHADAKPLVRRAYQAFGADRILWGGLGHSMLKFERSVTLLDQMFDFLPEAERGKIRGLNAKRLFARIGAPRGSSVESVSMPARIPLQVPQEAFDIATEEWLWALEKLIPSLMLKDRLDWTGGPQGLSVGTPALDSF